MVKHVKGLGKICDLHRDATKDIKADEEYDGEKAHFSHQFTKVK